MIEKIDVRSLLPDELRDYFVSLGEKPFRAKQVFPRLHKGERLSEITNLSKDLRERLANETLDTLPEVEERLVSKIDGTVKYLFRLYDGELIGAIELSDTVREESKSVISKLKKLGIAKTVMLTGDNEATAKQIAEEAGVRKVIGNVLPDGKEEVVRRLCEKGKTAMVDRRSSAVRTATAD